MFEETFPAFGGKPQNAAALRLWVTYLEPLPKRTKLLSGTVVSTEARWHSAAGCEIFRLAEGGRRKDKRSFSFFNAQHL